MKSIFSKAFLAAVFLAFFFSCAKDDSGPAKLDQSSKFSEFGKLLITEHPATVTDRNDYGIDPFADPDRLTEEEIEQNAAQCTRVYLEIKEEYMASGRPERDFNAYFSDGLTTALTTEVYPVYSSAIESGDGPGRCWAQYGRDLLVSSMDYTVHLGACGILNPACSVRAYLGFARSISIDYANFSNCLREVYGK